MPINGPLLFHHSHRLLSLSIFFNVCNRVTEWKLIKKKKYRSRANVSLLEILSLVNCVSPRNSPFAVSIYTIDSKINQIWPLKLTYNSVKHFYNFSNIPPLKVIKIIIRFVSKVLKKKKEKKKSKYRSFVRIGLQRVESTRNFTKDLIKQDLLEILCIDECVHWIGLL